MITTKPRSTPSLFARVSVALALLSAPFIAGAQAMESAEPFKVGTFAINDIPTVGLVMRDDALVVDLNAANRAMQLLPQYSHLDMPVDMIGLIERYEYGLKYRIYEVVNWLVEEELLSGSAMRDFVYPVANVDIMAPIQYPSKIMNAAVNFYTHACEGCNDDELAQRTKERRENRGVPYLFLKPTRGAVIGDGEDIIMPYGRDEIEYEVEMAIVFGRTGKYISADRAYDHVFGYMVAMDVSDRGGRPPGGYAMRDVLGGAKAIVPSSKKVGGVGARLDVPVTHIEASYVRSHFDSMEIGLNDAPRANEMVLTLVMTTGARVHNRAGGLQASKIEGKDGLR